MKRQGSTRSLVKTQKLIDKNRSLSPSSARGAHTVIPHMSALSQSSPYSASYSPSSSSSFHDASPTLDTKTSSAHSMEIYFLDSSSIFVKVKKDTTVHDIIAAIVCRLAIPTGSWSVTAAAVIGLFGWNGDDLKLYSARSKSLSISTFSKSKAEEQEIDAGVHFHNPTVVPQNQGTPTMPCLIPLRPNEKRASLPSLGVPLYDTENIHEIMEEGQYPYTGLVCSFKVSMCESNAPRGL